MVTATHRDADQSGASMRVIMTAGAIVLALSFGVRSVFGGVLSPLSADMGWPREVFSLSLAIQNLVWGLSQPFFGIIADKYGDRPALWLGFGCYLVGMIMAVIGMSPMMQHLGAGVFVGMGVAGTAFGLVLAVVGRASSPEKRSQNLGFVAALGSLGQVVMPFAASVLISAYDWRVMLIVMTALLVPMVFCIPFLQAAPPPHTTPAQDAAAERSIMETLVHAAGYRSYLLLTLGFFVCGFHVTFISVHFPAFISEMCGDPALGLQALSVIGAMNVVGTLAAGHLGALFPKNYVLSVIYALRALVIFVFISFPVTPLSVILFAASIGPLWLSTVPLTSGLVAGMFGPKHMATLYGFVFLSHQVGSFVGVYFGGVLYDAYNSYDIVWWSAIVLGIAAAIVHLPVREEVAETA
jgi:MFS family permease